MIGPTQETGGKKFIPRSITVHLRTGMEEEKTKGWDLVETDEQFSRMTVGHGKSVKSAAQEARGSCVFQTGFPADSDTEASEDSKPAFPAETAVKKIEDGEGKPGYPAEISGISGQGEKDYICYNCNKSAPGHTTSDCRRNRGRRFQPRDGARAERFQQLIVEKETALRRIEQDRRDEDIRIRELRDDEVRAERQAREERYRREDRETAERRRRQDRQWDETWDEKVRVYRSHR